MQRRAAFKHSNNRHCCVRLIGVFISIEFVMSFVLVGWLADWLFFCFVSFCLRYISSLCSLWSRIWNGIEIAIGSSGIAWIGFFAVRSFFNSKLPIVIEFFRRHPHIHSHERLFCLSLFFFSWKMIQKTNEFSITNESFHRFVCVLVWWLCHFYESNSDKRYSLFYLALSLSFLS